MLEKDIIKLLEEYKNYFKITNHCKILLLFLVWMNSLKKIEIPFKEPEKYRNSYHNLSSCPKFSLDFKEDSFLYLIQLMVLKLFLMEKEMTIPKLLSI